MVPAAPLLLSLLLPGCPGGDCVGPGCEDVYSAAYVSVFHGDEEGLGSLLDPFDSDHTWFSLTGSEAMGPDWDVVLASNTVAVGAPDMGGVLIFHLDIHAGVSPGGMAVVTPDLVDEQEGTELGSALLAMDLDADGRRELVVAAPAGPGRDDAAAAGRLYFFESSGYFSGSLSDSADPAQRTTSDASLLLLGSQAYEHSGTTLADCADLDGDGIGELAVASRWSGTGAALGGAITLVSSAALRAAAVDGETRQLDLADTGPSFYASQVGASAGAAISCDTDLDGDGLPELLVGAPFADQVSPAREATGAIYVLSGSLVAQAISEGSDLALEQAASAVVHGPSEEAYLGTSLAIGNAAADEHPDLLAGAPGAGGREQGQALLYADLDLGTAEPSATLTFQGEGSGARFGSTVALADLDGDGIDEIIAGAPRQNPSGSDDHFASGAVYIWYGDASYEGWNETSNAGKAETTIFRSQAWLSTGEAIFTGDVDSDGRDELALVHRILPSF